MTEAMPTLSQKCGLCGRAFEQGEERQGAGDIGAQAINVRCSVPAAICIVGCVLLALRHPDNEGPCSMPARVFARGLAEAIIRSGLIPVPQAVYQEWARELGIAGPQRGNA